MFLHLGGDYLTKLDNVIVIINSENPLGGATNQDFLRNATAKNVVYHVDPENNKSIVITDQQIFMSPISTHTLKKRANFIHNLA
jgi:hypothetical protein